MVATLITAENKISSNTRTISAGLSITLEKGWKTYWRSPGQVGLPPEIDWEDSTNVLHTKFYWPTPERFQEYKEMSDTLTILSKYCIKKSRKTFIFNCEYLNFSL